LLPEASVLSKYHNIFLKLKLLLLQGCTCTALPVDVGNGLWAYLIPLIQCKTKQAILLLNSSAIILIYLFIEQKFHFCKTEKWHILYFTNIVQIYIYNIFCEKDRQVTGEVRNYWFYLKSVVWTMSNKLGKGPFTES